MERDQWYEMVWAALQLKVKAGRKIKQKQPFADVLQNRCSLKIWECSQENTYVGVSF